MKLCEHPEFEQAILNALENFAARKLRPAVIEKDYYVTEALRAITQAAGPRVIFKGGTSLSKGWNLIDRFSEDIDLFLDPTMFEPELGKRGIDRELKSVTTSQLIQHSTSMPAPVKPSVALVETTVFHIGRSLADLAKLHRESCWKPARQVDESPLPMLN